ncbi:MAG: hypothetical protein F2911_11905 [Actinobacteria bacterium]|nr:hypothetical protein [Actinomycetota bacterium]
MCATVGGLNGPPLTRLAVEPLGVRMVVDGGLVESVPRRRSDRVYDIFTVMRRNRILASKWSPWVLAVLASLATLAVGLVRGRQDFFATQGDGSYDVLASSLASHGVYLDAVSADVGGHLHPAWVAYRPPGFPMLLASFYWVLGRSPSTVVLLQSLLVAAIVLATVFLAQVFLSKSGALAAGAIAAFFPYSFVQSAGLIDTPLYTATSIGALAVILRRPLTLRSMLVVAALLSVATLTRPAAILVVVGVAVWLVAVYPKRRLLLAPAALFLVVVGVWVVRDSVVLHSPVTVATNGGWNLYLGNNDRTATYVVSGRSLDRLDDDQGHPDWASVNALSEVGQDQYFRDLAAHWMFSNPGMEARTLATKAAFSILPVLRPDGGGSKGLLFLVTAVPLYGLGAVGLFRLRRRRGAFLLIWTVAATLASEIVFFPYTRILSPVFPILAIGFVAVVWRRRWRPRTPGSGLGEAAVGSS